MAYVFAQEETFMAGIAVLIAVLLIWRITLARRRQRSMSSTEKTKP